MLVPVLVDRRETQIPYFLEVARKVANYYIEHLPPNSLIPPWDFQAPAPLDKITDTSAAAIAACAFMQLADYQAVAPQSAKYDYMDIAVRTVRELSTSAWLSNGGVMRSSVPASTRWVESVLDHGTYDWPTKRYDHGVIWGDAYFIEAFTRLAAKRRRG